MSVATTERQPAIELACLVVLSTYPANGVNDLKLQHWVDHPESGEQREVQPMHDCLAVLQKVNAPDETVLKHLRVMTRFSELHGAPTEQRFGSTNILIVQLADTEVVDGNLCQKVIRSLSENPVMPTVESLPDGSRLACWGDENLLLICGSEQIDACLDLVFGRVRLLETLRHKVQGQFAEYENSFRQPYLAATEALRHGLQKLNTSWKISHHQPHEKADGPTVAVRDNRQITHDYTEALLAQGPVRQIETMLTANLRNLDETLTAMLADHRPQILQQRATSLQMLLAQVRSDVQYAQPMLEAAHSVTQSFHSQMLADLTSEETKQNQQRSAESTQRDRHNLTLTLLGLWIGLNQLLSGWLSLPDPIKNWNVIHLLGCVALPTVLVLIGWLGFRVFADGAAKVSG